MEWTAYIDGYCERIAPGLWGEPVNAVTNVAFLLVALVMGLRLRGRGLELGYVLIGILAGIGLGSFLFHTFATRWAASAETAMALLFVLTFTFALCRDMLRLPLIWAALLTLAFFPLSGLLTPMLTRVPLLGASAANLPFLFWLAGFALIASGRLAWDLWTGAALLALALTLRSLDEPMCGQLAIGTHFFWHLLNALTLGWLIETYRRNTKGAIPLMMQ